MAMSRKHYQMIAKIINELNTGTSLTTNLVFYDLIDDLCDAFEKDNPEFSRGKFADACQIRKKKIDKFGGCEECAVGKHGFIQETGFCSCCHWLVSA